MIPARPPDVSPAGGAAGGGGKINSLSGRRVALQDHIRPTWEGEEREFIAPFLTPSPEQEEREGGLFFASL